MHETPQLPSLRRSLLLVLLAAGDEEGAEKATTREGAVPHRFGQVRCTVAGTRLVTAALHFPQRAWPALAGPNQAKLSSGHGGTTSCWETGEDGWPASALCTAPTRRVGCSWHFLAFFGWLGAPAWPPPFICRCLSCKPQNAAGRSATKQHIARTEPTAQDRRARGARSNASSDREKRGQLRSPVRDNERDSVRQQEWRTNGDEDRQGLGAILAVSSPFCMSRRPTSKHARTGKRNVRRGSEGPARESKTARPRSTRPPHAAEDARATPAMARLASQPLVWIDCEVTSPAPRALPRSQRPGPSPRGSRDTVSRSWLTLPLPCPR